MPDGPRERPLVLAWLAVIRDADLPRDVIEGEIDALAGFEAKVRYVYDVLPGKTRSAWKVASTSTSTHLIRWNG